MLELDGLTRQFGAVRALDGLTMTVPAGQMSGFVGANGAGKTTAMRIVMGVTRADAGEVRFAGQPVGPQQRRSFGYMPEERGLYPKMRAVEQLTYFGRLHGMTSDSAQAAATHWLGRFGLAERARDRVETLSLGNQQRVQLAAALVHSPELLVLDEPFSGLDPGGVDDLSEVLREQARGGVPVVFSSHQLELVERLCDTVAIISGGRLVASGGVEQLRAGGPRLLRVAVAGADGQWATGLVGVQPRGEDDRGLLFELDDDTDDQAVLDAARRAGPVRHFAAEQPTLAELYRSVTLNQPDAQHRSEAQ